MSSPASTRVPCPGCAAPLTTLTPLYDRAFLGALPGSAFLPPARGYTSAHAAHCTACGRTSAIEVHGRFADGEPDRHRIVAQLLPTPEISA